MRSITGTYFTVIMFKTQWFMLVIVILFVIYSVYKSKGCCVLSVPVSLRALNQKYAFMLQNYSLYYYITLLVHIENNIPHFQNTCVNIG